MIRKNGIYLLSISWLAEFSTATFEYLFFNSKTRDYLLMWNTREPEYLFYHDYNALIVFIVFFFLLLFFFHLSIRKEVLKNLLNPAQKNREL